MLSPTGNPALDAGVENPIFFNDNTDMLLGDAKETCEKIKSALSEL